MPINYLKELTEIGEILLRVRDGKPVDDFPHYMAYKIMVINELSCLFQKGNDYGCPVEEQVTALSFAIDFIEGKIGNDDLKYKKHLDTLKFLRDMTGYQDYVEEEYE